MIALFAIRKIVPVKVFIHLHERYAYNFVCICRIFQSSINKVVYPWKEVFIQFFKRVFIYTCFLCKFVEIYNWHVYSFLCSITFAYSIICSQYLKKISTAVETFIDCEPDFIFSCGERLLNELGCTISASLFFLCHTVGHSWCSAEHCRPSNQNHRTFYRPY